MTVCANSPDETVQSAIAEGKRTGIKVVTDTIGVKDQVARARQCVEWGIDMIYLHYGMDQRRSHPTEDGVPWVADVCAVAGQVPVGIGCFGIDDAVRGVRAGASLVTIGHPIFSEKDFPGALASLVEKVKAAR
jgi:3-keto-L-gulonate-6-phosphate decarboxylase